MSTTFMCMPRALQHFRAQLQQMNADGNRETSRLMALAECNFRIAVHPDTPAVEAVDLLQEAVKIDGANPKYAYHLGRILFLRGDFKTAARWFRLACCLVPTSHRIWGHVAVLLRELNAVYHGMEEYEANILRQRAEAIFKAVREGSDNIDPDLLDFVPPRSRAAEEEEARHGGRGSGRARAEESGKEQMRPSAAVRRYLNARTCRWSGVDHLFIEHTLEGRPTQANVRRLLPVLEELAATACEKPGMPAAVAILCVQWLVRGYPVETIRRIMGSLPESTPSTELLDTVCRVFEAPPPDVPRMLAAAIRNGQIPPLVAAMIHRQRLLWQPLEYRSLGVYRAACRLAAETNGRGGSQDNADATERNEAARDLVRRLERTIAALDDAPSKPLQDELPQKKGPAGGREMLDEFEAMERGVNTLNRIKDEGFRLIKEGLEAATSELATSDACGQAAADRRAAEEFTAELAKTVETAIKRCYGLSERLPSQSDVELPDDFASRSEAVIGLLQSGSNLGKFAKVLRRIDKRLAEAAHRRPPQLPQPAAEWSALLGALRTSLPSDSSQADTSAFSLADRLQVLEAAAACVQEVRDTVSEFLRTTLEPAAHPSEDDAYCAQAAVDHKFVDSILKELYAAGERGLQQLESLRELVGAAPTTDLPKDLDVRMEAGLNRFRAAMNLGSLRKRHHRIGKKLAAVENTDPNSAPAPSKPLADLLQQLASVLNEAGAASAPSDPGAATALSEKGFPAEDASNVSGSAPLPQKREPPPGPSESMPALAQLQLSLTRTDWFVLEMFAKALETFDCYPSWVRMLPSFESLQRQIRGKMAETLYRLGRREMARRIWNHMLRTNRLDVDALKNIAVCDTVDNEMGRSQKSWREYLELLYLFDILGGTPRAHCRARAEFHRAYGNAYAPAFLSMPFDHEWKDKVDVASLISFLSSRGRFRSYIEHRLLEYLNTRFQFESPSLVLGIKRVEAESLTAGAEEKMTAFIQEVGKMIPKRATNHFTRLAEHTIRQTAEICRQSRQLTLQATPRYDEEEKQHVEMLARIFDLKIKLVIAFREHVQMVKNITSFEFLHDLSRLDVIPLQISPGLMPSVAHTLRVDPEVLPDLTASLRQNVILALVQYLLADDDKAESAVRQRQYELLLGKWLQDKEFSTFARLVDTPPRDLMPKEAAEAVTSTAMEPALTILCDWQDRYPAMGGFAVLIAQRLIGQKRYEEARERLEKSRPVIFYEPTRRHVQYLLVQILIRTINPLLEDEKHTEALEVGIEMVRVDDFQKEVVRQTLDLYVAVSMQARRRCREADVTKAVEGWLARATLLASLPEDENDLPRPTPEDIEDVRSALTRAREQVGRLS